tara:strand:- start:1708 stop:2517 length:810 start_codon:yes stop_codon:yes gene_type:complete
MQNSIIYCLSIHDELLNTIRNIKYIPVGLGENTFGPEWLKDNTGKNISSKNKFYGEYTFHYWLWKNKFNEIPSNTWLGFSTYRRHWKKNNKPINKNYVIENEILQDVPDEWESYETILADKIDVRGLKFMKILKHGKLALLKNPSAIFKKNRNLKFNFDMYHGCGLLDKAINLLDSKNKDDFFNFVKKNTEFSPYNMFICKNKIKLDEFYETLFEWLTKCEKIFGFDLEGYGKIRIYGFLSERFMPFWFNKNTKVLEWPVLFHDLRERK